MGCIIIRWVISSQEREAVDAVSQDTKRTSKGVEELL